MSRFHRFPMRSGIFSSAVVALAGRAQLPKDPCALLKPTEIQAALATTATVGAGVPKTNTAPLAVSCTYTWGPKTSQWGESSLILMVLDASKAWPDLTTEQIQQSVLTPAKAGKPNASVIAGVGEAAVFTFKPTQKRAQAEAYFARKGVHLAVEFRAGDALAKKDELIVLLKQAAARL
jgi:hypothetical protein